jgi:RNA polymerase sigma-70 factor (ECF subfamily)
MTDAEFEAVFYEHKDAVYRFAWRMTSSPEAAEDIAQEVFLSFYRRPDGFNPMRGTLRSFLLGAVRNLALKRWRGESRFDELDGDRLLTEPIDITRGNTAELVGAAVRSLPPLQREALVLAEYEEMSLEEIGSVVQADVGTVKSRLHRARENLRRALAPLKSGNPVNTRTRHGTVG